MKLGIFLPPGHLGFGKNSVDCQVGVPEQPRLSHRETLSPKTKTNKQQKQKQKKPQNYIQLIRLWQNGFL